MKAISIKAKLWILAGILCGAIGYFPGQGLIAQGQHAQGQQAQRGFATPQAAADALIEAAQRYDVPALEAILGPHSEDLVSTKDPVQDRNRAQEFAAKAREGTSLEMDGRNPNRTILMVGSDGWPFPAPIVLRRGQWYFDMAAGRNEILMRRVGQNELDAITVCRVYVDAQKQYAENSGNHEYAQRIISTPGKQDGLYWDDPDGAEGSPLADAVARAIQEGYSPTKPAPYRGYYFKVLKGQGPAAPLGQLDFVTQGLMIGGFALVAAPAEYRITGVKTFIVSHDGVVYEKDLGPNTLKIFETMKRYNPDNTWTATDDEW